MVNGLVSNSVRAICHKAVPNSVRIKVAAWRQRARHVSARADPQFRESIQRLGALHGAYAGETCVVIGNGPSMRDFDLARLRHLKTFCLNRGYLMWNEQGHLPSFLIAVNDLVIEQFAQEIQALNVPKFIPWLHRQYFDNTDDSLVFFEERWDETFITDARRGVASLATVTNTALQLAYHMGFTTVVLIGIDHRFNASKEGQPNEMIVQRRDDVDHFRPDYFAPGTRWHLPDLELSERGYQLARAAFERDGRRIFNATPKTGLTVFEKINLNDFLDRLNSP